MAYLATLELNDCVAEFKKKQADVVQSFISGIVELGSILKRHREDLKPQGKWLEYCGAIEIHISQANNYIRMYEYASDTSRKELLDKTITNRSKLNLFLSLPEDIKDKVLESTELDVDTPSEIFREKVSEIRDAAEPIIVHQSDALDALSDDGIQEEQINVSTMIQNPEETSRLVVKKLGLSANARKPMTGILYIEKGINQLETSENMTDEDKSQIRELLEERIETLQVLLDAKYN